VQKPLNFLKKQSKPFWIVTGLALIVIIGIVDFLTEIEFTVSLFYMLPILLITWVAGRWPGIMASVLSTLVWLITDIAAGKTYSNPFIYIWNIFIELSFFVIFVLLLSTVRRALEHERELAHSDYLTGAVNSRLFIELLQMEINRSQRYQHPFTLAYMDLDNFKFVNDQFGHPIGDQVLRSVVDQAKKHLRTTDVFARLGGDEFAVLLPETDQESAKVVFSKILSDISLGMQQSNWSVTLSIGVLTCLSAPRSPDEIVKIVDDLMYSVKREGKDSIKYSTYAG
jgi:diguanylate cyclase (GGDEF)-like protein